MKVLLIEDDPVLGESLEEFLRAQGCEVRWVQDVEKITTLEYIGSYDVVILDLILKNSNGEDILESVRRSDIDTPIVILTAKQGLNDKEVCFNLGADDYITKPFEPKELILRLKAVIRRKGYPKRVSVGDTIVDMEGRAIFRNGKEIHISKTAWELLSLLIRNRGKVVSLDTILNCVWGDKPVGSDIVRAYIKELRKVLPPEHIKTYKGVGYKLI